MKRTIDGVPYNFTRNDHGWMVVCLEKQTSRFSRSHQVYCRLDGTPTRCSCPDCATKRHWCKHLREVEAIHREQQDQARKPGKAKPQAPIVGRLGEIFAYRLTNDSGIDVTFEISGQLAMVTEDNLGTRSVFLTDRDRARQTWAGYVKAGMRQVDGVDVV